MKLVHFFEADTIIARNQPQYKPMPAFQHAGDEGKITCCWRLTFKERLRVLVNGRIWHHILTFRGPVQPQLLTLDYPDFSDPIQPKGHKCKHCGLVNLEPITVRKGVFLCVHCGKQNPCPEPPAVEKPSPKPKA